MTETTLPVAPTLPPPVVDDAVPLARYWRTLGMAPTRSLEQLDANFYVILEQFPANPTEEEEERRQELHHAYAILRRSLQNQAPPASRLWEGEGLTRRQWIVVGTTLGLSLALLAWLNLGAIRLRMVTHEPGTVLRIQGQAQPYGTVLRFERHHAFPVGTPGPAYEIRRAGTGETVWVGERVAEKGMVPSP